jgi:hypothetical protein
MSFNMGSSKQKQKSQTDPWGPTVEPIKDFISSIPTQATGATAAQQDAFGELRQIANQGDPNAKQIASNARQELGYTLNSTAPMAQQGYDDYTRRMSSVADGQNQDIGNDPYLQKLLTQVGDEAANRNRASFAAAGRDGSGYDMQTTARGVTQAQLPILVDQLNRERARTDTAAGNLYGAANTSAQNILGLNKTAAETTQGIRQGGIATNKAALESKAFGPTQILNIEEQLKMLPYDEASKIAELLYGGAKLGQQSEGTSKNKSTGFGFSLYGQGKA